MSESLFPSPGTPQEWQIAVDAAQGCLALEYTRLLGFISGGAAVNVERCVSMIQEGAKHGIEPNQDAIREYIGEASDETDRERLHRVVKSALRMSGNPELSSIVPFLSQTAD